MRTQPHKSVYNRPFAPIRLKELMAACDISQEELSAGVAELTGKKVSRNTVNLVVNRGYLPPSIPEFADAVEQTLAANTRAQAWLVGRGLYTPDIWQPLGRDMRMACPADHARRISRAPRKSSIATGDPLQLTITWEVEMIAQEALKHFKLFRNPFIDDIQKDSDIYMSEEHRYIEASMLDAARHGGFLAVVGEVGSGKSVMRRKIVEQLRRDGDTLVIYPQMIDKTKLTAGSICDAIIQDISNEKCRVKLEDKTRQVQRLLMDRAKSGYRHVLIVEEAHDLKPQTLKYLKRFYELEDGYRKLLGIILIGQSELKHLFDERQNVDMREVIRRVQVAEIRGLNGNLREYVEIKFRRIGKSAADILAEDAYAALGQRLTSTSRDGKRTVSHAYPLLVNNYVARAMNLAYEMGEPLITGDVVMAI
jgi:type II secretory pathway predicted ATPase ExeA